MQNQNHNLPMKPSNQPFESSKNRQIAHLVRQSYDIFNKFGRNPDELKSLTHAFLLDLENYSAEQITTAFTVWRRNNSVMPTPADILKIIQSLGAKTNVLKFSEFQQNGMGGWQDYKIYLASKNALSPNLYGTI